MHLTLKGDQLLRYKKERRGRDSNPRYRFKPVQRFSKPALSATQAPLRTIGYIQENAKLRLFVNHPNSNRNLRNLQPILLMLLLIMPGKAIAKIIADISEYAVHMIAIVLIIIVFYQKLRTLYTIIMGMTRRSIF